MHERSRLERVLARSERRWRAARNVELLIDERIRLSSACASPSLQRRKSAVTSSDEEVLAMVGLFG